MSIAIKCWEVSEGLPPEPLQPGAPRLEGHLEDWLERDISMLDSGLLVIGRQVENIDILALDGEGRLVAIELKRNQLPRVAVAQVIDYASLIANWPPSKVVQVAEQYFSDTKWADYKSLGDAFEGCFEKSLDDVTLNNSQRTILVGVRMEPSVQRMMEWLSENGVDANVALFSFFDMGDERHVLARTFALSEEIADARRALRQGKRPAMSYEQIQDTVSTHGIEQHVGAFDELEALPRWRKSSPREYGYDLMVAIPREGKQPLQRKAVQIRVASATPGTLPIVVLPGNLAESVRVEARGEDLTALVEELERMLETSFRPDPNTTWRYEVELTSAEEARALVSKLRNFLSSRSGQVGDTVTVDE